MKHEDIRGAIVQILQESDPPTPPSALSEPGITAIKPETAADIIRSTIWPDIYKALQTQKPQMQLPDIKKVAGGKVFTVEFIKRSDNSKRVMNARLGVKSYLHGGNLTYNPAEKKLIPVFDIQKRKYRMISIPSISRLSIGGVTYTVNSSNKL